MDKYEPYRQTYRLLELLLKQNMGHDDIFSQECAIFTRAGVKINTAGWDFTEVEPLYNMITVLR